MHNRVESHDLQYQVERKKLARVRRDNLPNALYGIFYFGRIAFQKRRTAVSLSRAVWLGSSEFNDLTYQHRDFINCVFTEHAIVLDSK